MKKLLHKIIWIMVVSTLVLSCPPTANEGSSSSGNNSGGIGDGSGDTGLKLYYSVTFKDGEGGVDGLFFASFVTVSPDGKNVYVTGLSDNALAVFTRNTNTGALTFVEVFKDGVSGVDGLHLATSVHVSLDGKNVYTTAESDNAVTVFTRNTNTGALTLLEVIKKAGTAGAGAKTVTGGLEWASSVFVSPDGKNVYALGRKDATLVVFTRDTTGTGKLTVLEVIKDNTNNVDGLAGGESVTVSPDGKNVYVVSASDEALAVFTRNTSTGTLTFLEVFKDGGVVKDLENANSVVVSPDGKNVYVASATDDALVVFARNTGTGALTYTNVFKQGENGINWLDRASSVAVSPDGNNVYVAARNSDTVAELTRDTSTGALTLTNVFKDGEGGIDGLNGARSVAVSPDGNNVYVVSEDANTLVVFERK